LIVRRKNIAMKMMGTNKRMQEDTQLSETVTLQILGRANGGKYMLELIKTTVLAGLGAGVITKDKADEAVSELVKQGKLTTEDAKRLVGRLLESGSQQWEEVQVGLGDAVRKALDSAHVARAGDVAVIARRLEEAEQRIAMLEDAIEKTGTSDNS
jgi:polyhydroxyalkanoate synthesis regulator phasin